MGISYTTHFKKIMTHPLAILTGVAIGAYIGIYHADTGKNLAPWGKLYLSALQMTIIPYIVVTVSCSIAKLLGAKESKVYIKKIVLTFGGMLLFVSLTGVISGVVMKPGNLDRTEMADIMKMTGFTPNRIITINEPIEKDQGKSLISFVTESIPSNVFKAFAKGEILQIVFFTLIFGVALGVSPTGIREQVYPIFDTFRETFHIIIRAVVVLLPIGVAFLFADQLSSISAATFLAMLKFLIMSILVMLIIFIICSIIIWRRSSTTYLKSLYAMRDSFFVVLSTRNSLVAMPAAIEDLVDNLKFDRHLVNLVIPLGIATCRYGNVVYFSFATLFIAQIYNTPLSGGDYFIVLIGAILAGLTTSGASGIVTLPMMALILDPLGLPLGGVLILFVAIDPVIDPFRSLIIVYANCAATTFIAHVDKDQESSSDILKKISGEKPAKQNAKAAAPKSETSSKRTKG